MGFKSTADCLGSWDGQEMGLEQGVKLASWGFRSGGPGMASSPEPHSEGHGKTGPDSPKADMGREAAGRLGAHLAWAEVWRWRQGGQQRHGLTQTMRSFLYHLVPAVGMTKVVMVHVTECWAPALLLPQSHQVYSGAGGTHSRSTGHLSMYQSSTLCNKSPQFESESSKVTYSVMSDSL